MCLVCNVCETQRSQSPELISKPVTREEEKATSDIKTLTERLSTALLNVSLKEDLAKQHAKVAEEAVAGYFLFLSHYLILVLSNINECTWPFCLI